VAVTRQYQELMGRARAIPFLKRQAFDLDSDVVATSLDGLFDVFGQEEQKIRTNPAARATALLKHVFGRSGCLALAQRSVDHPEDSPHVMPPVVTSRPVWSVCTA